MDIDDTTDDSGQNLMHQTNKKIRIGENAKVTQHDPYFHFEFVIHHYHKIKLGLFIF